MNAIDRLGRLIGLPNQEFAPYPIAEGIEEHRIKREILRKIRKTQASAAAGFLGTRRGGAVHRV
jgi:hypothetical protein